MLYIYMYIYIHIHEYTHPSVNITGMVLRSATVRGCGTRRFSKALQSFFIALKPFFKGYNDI